MLGGYEAGAGGNVVVDRVDAVVLDGTGLPGTPFTTTALPAPVSFGEAVAVDDWIFVIGGKPEIFAAPGSPAVYAAHVLGDGRLEAWTTPTPLPVGRTNHEVVLHRDWLWVLGGALDAGGLDTVYRAEVRR
jgi:hypothetical protein